MFGPKPFFTDKNREQLESYQKNKLHMKSGLTNLPAVQLTPSPSKPRLHVQLNEPIMLLHKAFTEQLWLPSVHSSTSGEKKVETALTNTLTHKTHTVEPPLTDTSRKRTPTVVPAISLLKLFIFNFP